VSALSASPRIDAYEVAAQALDEATRQAMAKDERVFVMGVGVDDPKGIFGTTRGAFEQFGGSRDAIGRTLVLNGIPHTVIIGRDGRVTAVLMGYNDDSIDEILEEVNEDLAAN